MKALPHIRLKPRILQLLLALISPIIFNNQVMSQGTNDKERKLLHIKAIKASEGKCAFMLTEEPYERIIEYYSGKEVRTVDRLLMLWEIPIKGDRLDQNNKTLKWWHLELVVGIPHIAGEGVFDFVYEKAPDGNDALWLIQGNTMHPSLNLYKVNLKSPPPPIPERFVEYEKGKVKPSKDYAFAPPLSKATRDWIGRPCGSVQIHSFLAQGGITVIMQHPDCSEPIVHFDLSSEQWSKM